MGLQLMLQDKRTKYIADFEKNSKKIIDLKNEYDQLIVLNEQIRGKILMLDELLKEQAIQE